MAARPLRQERDERLMAVALALARRALGSTSPNPAVGAVITDRAGRLIACGATRRGGRPHAETEALRIAGEIAKGATLYVTLEPCSHVGRTPPCADAIVAAGISRVVSALEDPNPKVKGEGHSRLRAAGIEVEVGLGADEARRIALPHILRVTQHRPAVTVKIALDEEGAVPFGHGGRPRIVTGAKSLRQAHLMRAHHDAILIGGGTLRDDDPELTCRIPGMEQRSPNRIVVTNRIEALAGSKLLARTRAVPLWVFTGPDSSTEQRRALEAEGAIVTVISRAIGGAIDIDAILAVLYERGITRLLVEGGTSIWRAFFKARRVDEVAVFRAGQAGNDVSAAPIPGSLAAMSDFKIVRQRDLGKDRLVILERA